jgi:hypothetical protein
MQKYATRGHDDIAAEGALTAVTLASVPAKIDALRSSTFNWRKIPTTRYTIIG